MEYTEAVNRIFKQLEQAEVNGNAIYAVVRDIPRELDTLHRALADVYAVIGTISKQIGALGMQLDAIQAAQTPMVNQTITHQCNCETDREKAARYNGKINRLFDRCGTALDYSQKNFLSGVKEHIAEQHYISKRQCEVVDRIIGEMS